MKTETSSNLDFSPQFSTSELKEIEKHLKFIDKLEQHVNNEEFTNVIYDVLELYPYCNSYSDQYVPFLEMCHLALGKEGVDEIIRSARLGDPISLYVLMLKKIFISPESYSSLESENCDLDDAIALFLAQDYSGAIQNIDSRLESEISYGQEDAIQLRILAKAILGDYDGAAVDCRELRYANRILQGSLLMALAGRPEEAMQRLRDFYRDIDSSISDDSEESIPKFRLTEEHFLALLMERIIAQSISEK